MKVSVILGTRPEIIKLSPVILEKTDAVCIHALSTLLHYVVALDRGVDPVDLGLTKPEDREHAYIQCVDPGGTIHIRRNGHL